VRIFPINRHRIWQLVCDGILIAVAWRLTFYLRFDKATPIYYRHLLDLEVIALVVGINLATFVVFGFYNRWWRYVSTRDMWGLFRGVTVGSAISSCTRSRPSTHRGSRAVSPPSTTCCCSRSSPGPGCSRVR